ncbi:dipeptidyl peptidase 3-like isoform X2 [Physella acuta]|nr:dipeptidyl peptidase 3-like isoform X2 [Physella acuta]XP_059174319.1 dipeptidyl peptidase 3-like isoform X2 [Physella acuta]XP_059174320.1 dipeptidyl peptidase 3-like isoform X2 [Physella acuta]XP_059174322.1 dipeptidyl peptidase 3-like isoform X2 [Physella acuta]
MTDSNSQYVIPKSTEVVLLDCKEAFDGLTPEEKLYAHYLAQASFKGGLIVLFQTSPESPGIFLLLQKLFRAQAPEEISTLAQSSGLTNEDVEAFFIYAAAFYNNMGNYKSFGDTKIVPEVDKTKLEALIKASKAYQQDPATVQRLWDDVKDRMYSLEGKQKELGLGEKGTTTYFSGNCDEKDAKLAQQFLDKKEISPYNTRLFKIINPSTKEVEYEVRLASSSEDAEATPDPKWSVLGEYDFTPEGEDKSYKFKVTRGDYSSLMALLNEELANAQKHAAKEVEKQMLAEYIKSFSTGSLPAHKDGSRHWIKNKGPIVETYIGFIESYRDPYGVRGEFEGFVAVVNKAMSAKFTKLVENAERLLTHLPWPAEYEKDKFLTPDFTSLDVLAFGGSGIPAGINIPNYDEIRQSEGFKNVSLGNVLRSGYKESKITFLREEDKELYTKYKIQSFEVQVGLHELLGHGSGKLFIEESPGKFNFDSNAVVHTETKEKITSWYKHGETWDSKFSTIASTYEECRAESVGIYLCLWTDVLKIFGHTEDEADDVIYVNWLNMVRAGLMALEFYSPETRSWRQAHMNARFVILRVLLEAGEGLVKVEKFTGEDGKPDLRVVLDRAKINSVGKPAIGAFLRKLQVYKSTADVEAGRKMYQFYSDVNDQDEPKFLSLRSIVMDRKQPRKLFVQHHTYVEDGEVKLKSYEASAASVVQSFVDRFQSDAIDKVIAQLWEKEKPFY